LNFRKILHSLQLSKVGSLVAVWTAQRNVQTPIVFEKTLNSSAYTVDEDSMQSSGR
jgi:hypothetical protein